DGLEVRSVLYRERPVDKDVRADVRKLDESIRTLQDQSTANQRNVQLLTEQRDYLTKLEQFVAPTATFELSKGVLNAETLVKLTKFSFEQRNSLVEQELKLKLEARNLQVQIATLQRQREQITQQSARTLREAVVFVNLKQAGGKMRVRYMVDQANWEPSYNIRADGKGGATIEYNAAIQQMSGEDWTDVAMTLSTATPSLVAKAPKLEPLMISLMAAPSERQSAAAYDALRQDFAKQKLQINAERNSFASNSMQPQAGFFQTPSGSPTAALRNNSANAPAQQADDDAEKRLNKVAADEQVAELLARESKKDEKGGDGRLGIRQPDEVISVTYDLQGRTTLPSRNDRQLIQVAALPVKGEFYKVAVPVLTSYVYDQATLINQSKMVLLAGPVSSYMNGQFVGHGEIPTVSAGESFVVGLGIDSSLRTTRERAEKTEVVQGGNRLLNYTYRLAVENFGTEPATVRLMDRLPSTRDGVKETDLRITLEPSAEALSQDAEYQRTGRKQGILRWDVKAPAGATGEKAFVLEYKFKVEYDKQMGITGMPAAAK
ncbi:MAG: mucoidy inhibitor MuiA family protein, partial [Phycisphaerae bacterium]